MTAQRHLDGPVLVIGSGLAGWSAVREFRKLDTTTPVVMITADAGDFYAKPALSNALVQGKDAARLVTTPAEKMEASLGVTLLQHTQVTGIDVQTQEVHTASKGAFAYRQLVLATGAQPIRLRLMGNAAEEVMSVNSLDDYAAFRAKLAPQARVLIIGAGLIGCEFANDLAASGYAVQVVDPAAEPLAALLPAEASAALREALEDLHVHWHFGTSATAVNRVDDACEVTFANGQTAVVDVVLSAVGLRADTVLAQTAGLATERGIVVNAQLQTSAPHALCHAHHGGGQSPGADPCRYVRRFAIRVDARGGQDTGIALGGGSSIAWNARPLDAGGSRHMAFCG
ncbi:FAD-dependent oxidoreductase [Limnohabitans sp.]|uniref:NAD(P)/FAD-dependent oxidoreductase n=1 Tax=Limnohabitans sp. TaxID=1907725 RepID=UPI00286F7909|nr:FAD-dependent oxidoreductase [Limnohabitans sp.]